MRYVFLFLLLLLNALDLLSQFQYKDRGIWYLSGAEGWYREPQNDTIQFLTKHGAARTSCTKVYSNRYELMRLSDSLWLFDVLGRHCFRSGFGHEYYNIRKHQVIHFESGDSVYAFDHASRKFYYALSKERFQNFKVLGDRLVSKYYEHGLVVDSEGKQHSQDISIKAKDFRNGLALAHGGSPKSFGIMDDNGKMVIECKYKNIRMLADSIVMLLTQEDSVFFYSVSKKKRIGPVTAAARRRTTSWDFFEEQDNIDISNGLIRYSDNGLIGIMDTSGRVIITPKYDWISPPIGRDKNMFIIYLKYTYGIITSQGEEVLPREFGFFRMDLNSEKNILSSKDGRLCLIDFAKGIPEVRYKSEIKGFKVCSQVSNGYFVYKENDRYGIMDTNLVKLTSPIFRFFKSACNGAFVFQSDIHEFNVWFNGSLIDIHDAYNVRPFNNDGVAMVDYKDLGVKFINTEGKYLLGKFQKGYQFPDRSSYCKCLLSYDFLESMKYEETH